MTSKSARIFAAAKEVFPGGVNSPVRAFGQVGRDPFIVESGSGPYLTDVDGHRYCDFVLSWGPLVLGHADPRVLAAISEQAQKGTSFGACCELEYLLAVEVRKLFPSLEMLRFVNSGTEAGMAVVRLARAFTGRQKIIKFAGCYHGHLDALLVAAGSGAATLSIPGSAGVPAETVRDTLIVEYNDLSQVEAAFRNYPDQIAAILVEPVAGNMGLVLPSKEFLPGLRDLCSNHGALLVFDEVMTGFRVNLSGAQKVYDVKPDLTMLGKVVGGGLPVGVFGGRADIMRQLAPLGSVYQAGTLSGNPLAMAAGLETLKNWQSEFAVAELATARLVEIFKSQAGARGIPLQAQSIGTMFGFFFNDEPVLNYSDAKESDLARYAKFFSLALDQGIYFAPSQFEAGFLSSSHTPAVMDRVQVALEKVFASL